MEIKANVKIPGMSKLDKASKAIQQMVQDVRDLNMLLAQTNGLAASAGGSLARMRSGRGASSAIVRHPGVKPPPIANPQQAMNYYAAGAAAGDPYSMQQFGAASTMANRNSRIQQQARAHMMGPNGRALFNIIARTRFANIGGMMKGMPLGIDMMKLLAMQGGGDMLSMLMGGVAGGGAAGGSGVAGTAAGLMSNPAGIAIAAAVAEITLFVGALKLATGYFKEIGKLQLQGGSNGVMGAMYLGGAYGLNIAGAGQNLSPYGAAYLGLSPVAGWRGDMDYNRRGQVATDAVRALRQRGGTADDARRLSDFLGQPELANAYYGSQESYDRLRNPGGMNSRTQMQLADDVKSIENNLSYAGQKFKQWISEDMAPFIRVIAIATNWMARFYEIIQKMREWLASHIPELGGSSKEDKHTDALNRNTKSLDDLHRGIKEGIYGGGQRANSFPSKLQPLPGQHYAGIANGLI